MRGDGPDRLTEVVIHAVDAVLFLCRPAVQDAFPVQERPQLLPDLRAVADGFREDVTRTGKRRLRIRYFFFRIDIPGRFRRGIPGLLQHQPQCQRFQPAFLRHGGAGPPLRPEGPVEILQFAQGGCFGQLCFQFIRQDALLFQRGSDLLPAFFQVPQVFQPFRHFAQHLVVQRTRRFLPVTGDKGDRVPRVQQFHRRLYLLRPQFELCRKPVYKIHFILLLLLCS